MARNVEPTGEQILFALQAYEVEIGDDKLPDLPTRYAAMRAALLMAMRKGFDDGVPGETV